MTNKLEQTYFEFDKALEGLGFSIERRYDRETERAYYVRVVSCSNREQMIQAGSLAPSSLYQLFVLAVAWTCRYLSPTKYEWAVRELEQIGISTLLDLCRRSYPKMESRLIYSELIFKTPIQYNDEYVQK